VAWPRANVISFRSYSGKLFAFKVASVLSPDSELLSADLVLVSEADFRAFFEYPAGHYTDIALSVANPLEVRNIAAKLAEALPDSRPILREEVLRTYQSVFDWREGIVLTVLSGAILAFVILAWEKASGLSAEEKREIGILKAIGWETGDVIRMKTVGRPADFTDRLPARFCRRLHSRLPLRRPHLRAGIEGLGRALPALYAGACGRRPADRHFVLFHGLSLHSCGAGADLASRDYRPRCGDAMIELSNIKKAFNQGKPNEYWALNGIDLTLEAGKVTAFRGPSGSGKTTLLTLVGCLSRPTSGRVRFRGEDISGLPERFLTEIRRQSFGFIFQQFNLIKGLSALENVILPGFPTGRPRAELVASASQLFAQLKLEHRLHAKVEWLSGGEQQRVAIARALINNPQVIIADEPTANLDTALSREFMAILESFTAAGKTVLLTSHDPLVVESSAVHRVVGIRDGKLTDD
jgi:putative ABC transport system ATP-binding protein